MKTAWQATDEHPDRTSHADAKDDDQPLPPHISGRGAMFRRRHRLYGSFALYGVSLAAYALAVTIGRASFGPLNIALLAAGLMVLSSGLGVIAIRGKRR